MFGRREFSRALRALLRQRGLTATALFSLTLGIGITTGTFTLLNAMVLRPVPGVTGQDRLLTVWLALPEGRGPASPWRLSYPDFQAVQRGATAFGQVAAAAEAQVSLDSDGTPRLARAELVTAEYFEVLGTSAERGRLLAAAEANQPVAVVSHDFWQTELGGGAEVVGRRLRVNGHTFTVVGVAPEHFHGMTPADATQGAEGRLSLWLPLSAVSHVRPTGVKEDALRSLDQRWLKVVGRVRDGVDVEAARASLTALGDALAAEFPGARTGARLVPGDLIFGPGSSATRVILMFAGLLIVPLLVLLIACVNVANLLLAAGVTRQRELALRLSLGASRRSLLGLLMRENLLLALGAGTLSLLFAAWTKRIASVFSINPAIDVPIDTRVLLFAFATALTTALGFGLLPALRATRIQPAAALAGGAASEARGTGRLRRGLVAAQLALCFILLVTCTLFVRSTGRGLEVATGFAEDELLLVEVNLDILGVTPEQGTAIHDRMAEEVAAVPGIAAFSTSSGMPLMGARRVRVAADADVAWGRPAGADVVGSGYFETAGLELVAGSGFDARDRGTAATRAVVNRALAEQLWPGESPLGRTLRLGEEGATADLTVIGVAENARVALREAAEPLVYLPLEAEYSPYRVYLFRTGDDLARVVPALRAAFRAADSRLPVVNVTTMRDLRQQALLPYRLTSSGLGALGLVALLLAAVGLYGLISYNVTRRTREIGVRVALGADRNEITRWVVRGSLATVLLGLAVGAPLAAALAFAIRSGLFGIPPLDPLSFGGIAGLLLLVGIAGTILPARRAAAVPPAIAIRTE